MLAELHGKLSVQSNSDFDRLEDLLTDYVFGALKYLDRRCLRAVLTLAIPDVAWTEEDVAGAAFAFWPILPGGTEPDVVATCGREMVIFEAKLHSGFGVGDDELDAQLVREWRHGHRWAQQRRLREPHVIAVTAGHAEPPEVAAATSVIKEHFGVDGAVTWISWQQIALSLEAIEMDLSETDRLLIGDVLAVMDRRGVRRVFTGFKQEDYWVVAAGTRIAADRIFPAVATFAHELLEQCGESGLVRGAAESKIVTTRSEKLQNPQYWGVTHINIPLWADKWPKRKTPVHGFLFVQFPLTVPVIRVGFRIRVNRRRKAEWRKYGPKLVSALRASTTGYEIVEMSYPDLGTVEETIAASEITTAWLESVIDRAEKYLAIQRTLPLDELTQTAVVRDLLLEDSEFIETRLPMLLEEAKFA